LARSGMRAAMASDVCARAVGCGTGGRLALWSVASVRSMRWLQARRWSSRGENGLSRQRLAAPNRQRLRGQLRPGNVGPTVVVVGFDLAGLSFRGPTARLEALTVEAVLQAAAEHAVRLSAQKLRPRRADPPGRRPKTRAAQHGRDRRGPDADPEFQQLTLDAHVAPPRVLPRQPSDQAARLGSERRTTGPATAAAATSLKQRSVPGAKRLRAHRKAGPACAGKQPAHRSEQRPVGGRVARPFPSAPEDRQLVAQHGDLKLPLTTAAGEHADNPAQESVDQRHQHDAQSEPARPRSPAPPARPNRISLPHTS
jgi:hypothetical protein